jgi:hypothetical protein
MGRLPFLIAVAKIEGHSAPHALEFGNSAIREVCAQRLLGFIKRQVPLFTHARFSEVKERRIL